MFFWNLKKKHKIRILEHWPSPVACIIIVYIGRWVDKNYSCHQTVAQACFKINYSWFSSAGFVFRPSTPCLIDCNDQCDMNTLLDRLKCVANCNAIRYLLPETLLLKDIVEGRIKGESRVWNHDQEQSSLQIGCLDVTMATRTSVLKT